MQPLRQNTLSSVIHLRNLIQENFHWITSKFLLFIRSSRLIEKKPWRQLARYIGQTPYVSHIKLFSIPSDRILVTDITYTAYVLRNLLIGIVGRSYSLPSLYFPNPFRPLKFDHNSSRRNELFFWGNRQRDRGIQRKKISHVWTVMTFVLNELAEALPRLEVPRLEVDAIPRAQLEAAVLENFSAIRNLLISLGYSNPSVTLLRKAAKLLTIHKCCSCPFHGDSRSQLRRHLRVNNCYYRQENFRIQKEQLLQRVRERTMDNNIEDFSDLYDMDDTQLTPGERATLDEILYRQLFLIRLR